MQETPRVEQHSCAVRAVTVCHTLRARAMRCLLIRDRTQCDARPSATPPTGTHQRILTVGVHDEAYGQKHRKAVTLNDKSDTDRKDIKREPPSASTEDQENHTGRISRHKNATRGRRMGLVVRATKALTCRPKVVVRREPTALWLRLNTKMPSPTDCPEAAVVCNE